MTRDRFRPIPTDFDRNGKATLTTEEKRVLDFIRDNGKIKRTEVMKLLDLKTTKAKTLLNKMLEKKLILRLGKGRETHYVLPDE
jgi:ATP-dependent DNA helicase RecG